MKHRAPLYVDREETVRRLGEATSGHRGSEQLRAWIRAVMIGNGVELEPIEGPLLATLIERLDAMADDDSTLIELASDFAALLRGVPDTEAAHALLDIAVDRDRFLDVMKKYQQRIVSRTQFLSFVAEQHWPPPLRRRVSRMAKAELDVLYQALFERDYRRACASLMS